MSHYQDPHTRARLTAKLFMRFLLWFFILPVVAFLIVLLAVQDAQAMDRPAVAWRLFQKYHPCPSTNKPTGACPGWVMQYKKPLADGGDIAPYNLKWVKK